MIDTQQIRGLQYVLDNRDVTASVQALYRIKYLSFWSPI